MGLSGVEPLTSRLSGVRSNHLSYRPPSPSVPAFLPLGRLGLALLVVEFFFYFFVVFLFLVFVFVVVVILVFLVHILVEVLFLFEVVLLRVLILILTEPPPCLNRLDRRLPGPHGSPHAKKVRCHDYNGSATHHSDAARACRMAFRRSTPKSCRLRSRTAPGVTSIR